MGTTSGPPKSGTLPAGPVSTSSTTRAATSPASTTWNARFGVRMKAGPPRRVSRSSWNWVARRIVHRAREAVTCCSAAPLRLVVREPLTVDTDDGHVHQVRARATSQVRHSCRSPYLGLAGPPRGARRGVHDGVHGVGRVGQSFTGPDVAHHHRRSVRRRDCMSSENPHVMSPGQQLRHEAPSESSSTSGNQDASHQPGTVAMTRTVAAFTVTPPGENGGMSIVDVEHAQIESRLGELMGIVNSTTAEIVSVIADVVEHERWAVSGIRSAEHWVAWQCGVSPRRARDLVTMARRRAELPAMSRLFDAGLLTEDAVAAVARRAPSERDGEVAELAPMMLHTQLTRMLSSLPRPAPDDAAETPRRIVTFGATGDRWRMRVDVPIDEGMVVERALVASRSQVFHERHPDESEETSWRSSIDWGDGLSRMAELALRAVDGGMDSNRRPADRFQVLVHVNLADGTTRWHMGDVVPDAMRRYLSCDADIRAVIESDGVLSAMTSRLRTVDDRMRAFVEHRDGGCVVPGCTQRRWLHIHHIDHWEDGGSTVSSNLCALCPLHHRLLHAGELVIEGNPDSRYGLVIRNGRGHELRPPPPRPPDEPPDPPPEPFRHPVGERVDWRFFGWFDETEIKPRQRRYDMN
jgi:Domain of unknown function (DUF222)